MNDSVYLAGSVLIMTVLCVCGVSGYHVTSHQPGVQFCVLAVAILLCNTSIICLLFLPKVDPPQSPSLSIPGLMGCKLYYL